MRERVAVEWRKRDKETTSGPPQRSKCRPLVFSAGIMTKKGTCNKLITIHYACGTATPLSGPLSDSPPPAALTRTVCRRMRGGGWGVGREIKEKHCTVIFFCFPEPVFCVFVNIRSLLNTIHHCLGEARREASVSEAAGGVTHDRCCSAGLENHPHISTAGDTMRSTPVPE